MSSPRPGSAQDAFLDEVVVSNAPLVTWGSWFALYFVLWSGFDHLIVPDQAQQFFWYRLPAAVLIAALPWLTRWRPAARYTSVIFYAWMAVFEIAILPMLFEVRMGVLEYFLGYMVVVTGCGALPLLTPGWTVGNVLTTGLPALLAAWCRSHELPPEEGASLYLLVLLAMATGILGGLIRRSMVRREHEHRLRLESSGELLMRQGQLAALGQLVAAIAHEVGNPLNFSIGGAQQLALEMPRLQTREGQERARAALRLIRQGTARIETLMRNLRGYLGGESGKLDAVDIRGAWESTVSLIQSRLAQQGVEAQCTLEALPPVTVEPGGLEQVFTNLLLNSLHAMPNGGVVKLQAEVDPGEVRLIFSDTGPGIPEHLQSTVFEPFFTTWTDAKGSGLGLPISAQILARAGGELRALPWKRGAAFLLRFPRRSEVGS